MMIKRLVNAIFSVLFTSFLLAESVCAAQQFQSKPLAATLVELYTSEGCSSCPPAERWMSTLTAHPGLFTDIVPIAFHVDYWDYLGWQDRFAQPAFSKRQRSLHKQGIFNGVYTPGMLAGSQPWQGWRRGKPVPMSTATPGVLRGEIDKSQLYVRFEKTGLFDLHIAYLGMGLSTEVTAGENNRRTLQHDFVVLRHWQKSGKGTWIVTLPEIPKFGQAQTALAVWVTQKNRHEVLQATGTHLSALD